jgi:hypothetical protein
MMAAASMPPVPRTNPRRPISLYQLLESPLIHTITRTHGTRETQGLPGDKRSMGQQTPRRRPSDGIFVFLERGSENDRMGYMEFYKHWTKPNYSCDLRAHECMSSSQSRILICDTWSSINIGQNPTTLATFVHTNA